MKLVGIYKNPIKGDKRLFPRDIRNYIASISKEDETLHKMIMGHESKQPTFIFSMPNRKSFAIYTFKKDTHTIGAMNRLKALISKNPNINIKDVSLTVKEAFTSAFDFTRFEYGFEERRLRTPLIIAATEFEYAMCAKHTKEDFDQVWLEKYVADKIKEIIVLTCKDWYGQEEADKVEVMLEEAIILFKDLEYCPIKYKENLYYPAVRGTIISNVHLPMFIGYKSGLGYGELSSLKEMDRRKGKTK